MHSYRSCHYDYCGAKCDHHYSRFKYHKHNNNHNNNNNSCTSWKQWVEHTQFLIESLSLGCCRYPLASISINTANPIETAWNGCNQSINFVCGLSSYLNTTVYKGNGVAADLNGTSSLIIPGDSPNIVSASAFRETKKTCVFQVSRSDVGPSNVTVSCNTTSHLWSISSQIGKESYYFSCIYHLANGSWLLGSTGTQIVWFLIRT